VGQCERGAGLPISVPGTLSPTMRTSLFPFLLLSSPSFLSLPFPSLLSLADPGPGEGVAFLPGGPAPLFAWRGVGAGSSSHEVSAYSILGALVIVPPKNFNSKLPLAQRLEPVPQLLSFVSNGVQYIPITLTCDPACEFERCPVYLAQLLSPASRAHIGF